MKIGPLAEHVSDLPLSAQAYFCDTRSPLRGLSLHAPRPLKSFLECPLTAPLPHPIFCRLRSVFRSRALSTKSIKVFFIGR